MKGKITEIYRGIQGEGIYIGMPQVFIRFYGCNLNCSFCDTPLKSYRIFTAEKLLEKVKKIFQGVNWLSITGGEPLEQLYFLKDFLKLAKKEKFKIYLETNGIYYKNLEKLIDYLDIISMDIKLPSSTKKPAFWKEHKKFFEIAKEKEVFVKVVICSSTTEEDFKKAISLIDKDVSFILQPNTFELDKLWKKLKKFQKLASFYLEDVRIIPQVHKLIGRDEL